MLRLIDNLTFAKPQWGLNTPPSPAWFLPLPREFEYCLLKNRVVRIRDAGKPGGAKLGIPWPHSLARPLNRVPRGLISGVEARQLGPVEECRVTADREGSRHAEGAGSPACSGCVQATDYVWIGGCPSSSSFSSDKEYRLQASADSSPAHSRPRNHSGSRLRQPLFSFLPFFSPVTPEVEVGGRGGDGRRKRSVSGRRSRGSCSRSSPWPLAQLLEGEELPPLFGNRIYHDGCDLKSSGSPGVMAQKHPGEGGLCGAHHNDGDSLRTSGPSVDPEILLFSGLRDSTETAPNGTRCLTEHSGPKYTQPPNPAHWSDPSHGPPRGPGPPREGGYPDESEASSEESGVDQELSRENETGCQEDGGPSFLSVPSACNCQGSPGIPEGTYTGEGDGSSSNFCHHCTSPALGEDEELEEEYDDEEPLKFPSDFSRVSSGKKPPSRKQRHRFLTKEDTRDSGRRDPRSSGRHRLGRKRSQADKRRGLGLWGVEELCQLGQAGFWWLIELLVLVGEYVETCGHLIYACRQLKGSDLDLFRVWMGVWAGRFGGWAQVMVQFLSQSFYSAAGLFTRFLRLVGAFLLLALALFLGCLQLGWRFLVGLGDRFGWRDKTTWLFSWLESPALRRCLSLLRDSRAWQQLVRLVQWDWLELPWVKQRTNKQGNAPAASGRYCQPEEEVARLLTMAGVPEDELNPFHVLGVEATASDIELKKAYRQLAVMVHPDKNHHPRAEEAFKVLRAAWDIVSNPERRKEYEMKRMAENELSRSVNEFLSKLQDDLKEAMNTMMCSRCQGKHRRFEMDREPKSARYCAECNRLHPAEEGDFWAESSMLGLKITYFALMDGKVYDITEWAGCQRVGISPDTHRVPYHISFGSRVPGTSGRQRAPPEAPPADLQDFLSRIFQVPPGQMSNGNFFAAPHPAPGATSTSKPNSTVPKGEAKPKRRKKVRRPFQR
ncbi:dnaJ-like subfamily C member 14 [Sigmodon hispidus]